MSLSISSTSIPLGSPNCLRPPLSHSLLVLSGVSFVIFEFIFVVFYANDFWFGIDISACGLIAVLVAIAVAHLLLTWQESERGCRVLHWLKRGAPLVVYRRWLTVGQDGFNFGLRRLNYAVVDAVLLNFFGNLEFYSRALVGVGHKPDLVLKVPLANVNKSELSELFLRIKQVAPHLVTNTRLDKRKDGTYLKGTAFVQMLGAAFMAVILLDLGYSTFWALQMLKDYYCAQTATLAGRKQEALNDLRYGDLLRTHPFAASWVTRTLLSKGKFAAGLWEQRALALFALGNPKEAIENINEAIKLDPSNFRLFLTLARFNFVLGQHREANNAITSAIAKRKHLLLPKLYLLSAIKCYNTQQAAQLYKLWRSEIKEDTFGDTPVWPPGGDSFLSESFHEDDLYFIFDKLFK